MSRMSRIRRYDEGTSSEQNKNKNLCKETKQGAKKMTIELSVLIAVLGFTLSVGTFFIGRVTAAKTSGQEYGVMLTEIGYIKSGVDDMKKKMEQSDKRYIEMEKRLSKVEEAMKIYHREETA